VGDRHGQLGPPAAPGRQAGLPTGQAGFTLVELMVVFMIISLLLSVLIPTINSLLGSVHKRRASALIAGLSNGALLYKTDHHYYPGQQYVNKLPDPADPYNTGVTGSQFLAAAMYGYTFNDIETLSPRPVSTDFMDYEPRHLFTWEGKYGEDNLVRRNTISDMFPTPMPICYYPSRMGPTGTNQYKKSDNKVYTDKARGTGSRDTFAWRIWNKPLGTAVMDRQFLLISPGRDRKYFTQDDINNFQCYIYSNE